MDRIDFELLLAGRRGLTPPAPSAWALKLLPDGLVGFDGGAVQVMPGKMAVAVTISTPALDRSRDVVLGKGIDSANHQRNPLVLLNHNRWSPIGRAEDSAGNYTVKVADEQTVATTYFFQNSFEAEQAFRLVEMKALNGGSLGFRVKPGGAKLLGDEAGRYCVIEACEMIEYSHVFFPDNPECLVSVVEKGLGGKPLCPMLRDAIVPLLPARNHWSPGADMVKIKTSAKTKDLPPAPSPAPDAPAPDSGPTLPGGARYLASLHAILAEALEFIEAESPALEPEVAEALGGLADGFMMLAGEVATAYGERYPDLPALDDEPDDEDPLDDELPAESPEEGKGDEPDEKPKRAGTWRTKLLATLTRFRERRKRLSKSAAAVVGEAADHLEDCAGAKEWSRTHRTASMAHSKALRQLCKGLDSDEDADDAKSAQAPPALDLGAIAAALKPIGDGVRALRTDLGRVTGKAV